MKVTGRFQRCRNFRAGTITCTYTETKATKQKTLHWFLCEREGQKKQEKEKGGSDLHNLVSDLA